MVQRVHDTNGYTAHQCAVIHEAMTATTKCTLENSEQHVELGTIRRNCDVSDLKTILAYATMVP